MDWSVSEKQRRKEAEAGNKVFCNPGKDKNLLKWAKSEGLFSMMPRRNKVKIPAFHTRNADGTLQKVTEEYNSVEHPELCPNYIYCFGFESDPDSVITTLFNKTFGITRGQVIGCKNYPDKCRIYS
jgi:hypothetical protein